MNNFTAYVDTYKLIQKPCLKSTARGTRLLTISNRSSVLLFKTLNKVTTCLLIDTIKKKYEL